MLLQKYKPTTQKSLFHKDIVNHIIKWIKHIKELIETKQNVKKILFLYGPIGCGKSVTVDILFKTFQLIHINSDYIRTTDKMNDVIGSVVSAKTFTLNNLDKLNTANVIKIKPNIVFVDNIELCDKSIQTFIDLVHVKNNINVPIIIISNNHKYKELFTDTNCTFIEFKKPSLLEMTKLAMEINQNEKLNLSKENLKTVIERTESDIRQLIFLLEQLRLKLRGNNIENINLDDFFNSIQTKMTDIDLVDKIEYLLDSKQNYDLEYSFNISCSEPQTISSSIYQNYLQNLTSIDDCINIIDDLSYSSNINHHIFDKQLWELYDNYTMQSCVFPSFSIKTNNTNNTNNTNTTINNLNIQPFKDISYNFLNSYQEVKRIHQDNFVLFNKKIYNKDAFKKTVYKTHTILEPKTCFHLANILIKSIDIINNYFDTHKKGKNTTKKEKFDLCENITGKPEENNLNYIIDLIYSYKIFEVDLDWIILHKKSLDNDDNLKNNVGKIDLRVFKRLLNIFTINDNQKILKSHTENAIQYKILQIILSEINETTGITLTENYIDNLTVNLDQIWNL